jgi:hypothetical protein
MWYEFDFLASRAHLDDEKMLHLACFTRHKSHGKLLNTFDSFWSSSHGWQKLSCHVRPLQRVSIQSWDSHDFIQSWMTMTPSIETGILRWLGDPPF